MSVSVCWVVRDSNLLETSGGKRRVEEERTLTLVLEHKLALVANVVLSATTVLAALSLVLRHDGI